MRVLTLWQPWASLLVYGFKKYETRPAMVYDETDFLIHAGKHWDKETEDLCKTEPFKSAIEQIGSLPLGHILGSVTVKDCHRIRYVTGLRVGLNSLLYGSITLTEQEKAFGNYARGRYVWECTNRMILKNPIPYKGHQGYYHEYEGNVNDLIFLL